MPKIFRGNISGSGIDISDEADLPFKCISIILINREAGINTVDVLITNEAFSVYVVPATLELQAAGSDGDHYITDVPFFMEPNDVISVSATANLDYYFNLENIEP